MVNRGNSMTEWQPIETAPRDGRDVLLTVGIVRPEMYYDCAVARWNKKWQRWLIGDPEAEYKTERQVEHDEFGSPTHWMPLPEPPTQE
jgi:hypothetical protein